jgi:hypothetical protein
MKKRYIKDEKSFTSKNIMNVSQDKKIIHPITLNMINTSEFINPICLTKLYISNNKINEFENYVCNGENKYKEYIQLPPISLNSQDLLEVYDINNIENLKDWVNNNIINYNHITLTRVITCWIFNNSELLNVYKKYFHEICINILKKYKNNNKILKYEDEIKTFINNWIDKYKPDENLDLYKETFEFFNKL